MDDGQPISRKKLATWLHHLHVFFLQKCGEVEHSRKGDFHSKDLKARKNNGFLRFNLLFKIIIQMSKHFFWIFLTTQIQMLGKCHKNTRRNTGELKSPGPWDKRLLHLTAQKWGAGEWIHPVMHLHKSLSLCPQSPHTSQAQCAHPCTPHSVISVTATVPRSLKVSWAYPKRDGLPRKVESLWWTTTWDCLLTSLGVCLHVHMCICTDMSTHTWTHTYF